ncbi:MAG TPA: nuclear transport factor 2 family protein [Vicinamibacterales bacterium]|jgi:nucleoid-associated protein YgaU
MTAARVCCYGFVVLIASQSACARTPPPPKEADVVAVVNTFYAGITAAKPADVMRLIAPDAVFIESGRIETRAEYEMNHLPADIEFEQKVKAMRGPLRVTFDGRDTAWVISRAEYDEGNPEKYIITQLMILTRDTGDWRIRSISWSSNQP